ncbi:TVP38/TMEM64 family protein [Caldicellulosiruptor naganoensis]|uniref:TVP38/TMEM64 family membrane protein n=1 Tax=Caldicellulosiruptor naganoensis TaxID=29324 RepID=A0ABY7BJF9_9FIRM|nr:TVP38/TMEM64 family protein [Caldicellulosiruptor naganoensis]WAM31875.1 TVP38/TMEM64 family protein [Caldicellulosiruptor naganoensis]
MVEEIKIKDRIKLWIFIFMIAVSIFALIYAERQHTLSPRYIKQYISHFGIWAPMAFLILYSIKSFIIFIPAGIFMLAAGLTFGTFLGSLILVVGTLLSSTVGFVFARYFGKDYVQKKLQNTKFSNLGSKIAQKGFLIILLLRLVPILPYDAINYICGLSKIKYKDFILATLIGTVPACFLYAYLGENLLKPFSKGFYFSVALVILISLTPVLFAKSVREFLQEDKEDGQKRENKKDAGA